MLQDFFTNILFPPACLVCEQRIGGETICEACFRKIRLRDSIERHQDLPLYIGGAGNYADPILQSLIHHLKFRGIKGAADPLGELILHYVSTSGIDIKDSMVIPIPLSQRRRRMRGYNQAELIARHVAQRAGLAMETRALVRSRHAKPQSQTESAAERKENVRGAFIIRKPELIRDRKILLIDDVTTSGTTFFEAAFAITDAGAQAIAALAAANA